MGHINRVGTGGSGDEEKEPASQKGREKWKARGKSGVTKQVQKKQDERGLSKKVQCVF